ncbi:MAG: IPT/TIG domain-containing protein [Planctomycetota bacterium]|nr:IPT/TIG domain-containing protein [Planctomycetota bacterium]
MRRTLVLAVAVGALLLSAGLACSKKSSKKKTPAAGLPLVTGVTPSMGFSNGTTPITISGQNFNGALVVALDDTGSTPLVGMAIISDTVIQATVPSGIAAGRWNVRVTTPAGTNATSTPTFRVVGIPTVTSVSPDNGPDNVSTNVTITGTDFLNVSGVALDDPSITALGTLTTVNDTTIIGAVPSGITPGLYNVQVTTQAGTNLTSAVQFRVTSSATPPPAVTQITPNNGMETVSTSVTINGSDFIGTVTAWLEDPATTMLTGVTAVSTSQIMATVPAGIAIGMWEVRVSADGGTSPVAGVTFSVTGLPPPTVTTITPNTGFDISPTPVTIDGLDFVGTVTAWLEDPATTMLTGVTVLSANQIAATVPVGIATGLWEVRVAADGGTSPIAGVTFDVQARYVGPAIYVSQPDTNEILVVNLGTRMAEYTIPVGLLPTDVAITPDESEVYVTNMSSGTVSVIETATNTVVATIIVGGGPAGIDFTPVTGAEAYVANSTTSNVSVIDVATRAVVDTIPVTADPGEIEFRRPQGDEVWVLTSGAGDSNLDPIQVIDPVSRMVVSTISDVGINPVGITFDQTGSTAYVTNVGNVAVIQPGDLRAIDVGTRTLGASTSLLFPFEIARLPGSDVAYVFDATSPDVLTFDTLAGSLLGTTITLSGGVSIPTGRVGFAPATDRAFVLEASGIGPIAFNLFTVDTLLDITVSPTLMMGNMTNSPVGMAVKEN